MAPPSVSSAESSGALVAALASSARRQVAIALAHHEPVLEEPAQMDVEFVGVERAVSGNSSSLAPRGDVATGLVDRSLHGVEHVAALPRVAARVDQHKAAVSVADGAQLPVVGRLHPGLHELADGADEVLLPVTVGEVEVEVRRPAGPASRRQRGSSSGRLPQAAR